MEIVMTVRSILLAAVALAATAPALSQGFEQTAEPQPAAAKRTLLAELAESMRELIEAVVPEISLPAISLPAIELPLPTLDADRR
jgi:hypothetical protein